MRLCPKPAGVLLEGREYKHHAVPSVFLRRHPGCSGCGLRPPAGNLETAVSKARGVLAEDRSMGTRSHCG